MDIDEFLEKETHAGKKEDAISAEKPVGGIVNKPAKEEKHQPAEEGIAQLEKKYFQVWSEISKSKLSWNSSLYTEINKLADEINRNVHDHSMEIDRQKHRIKELIAKAQNEMKNSNYEQALGIYSEIISARDNIPDIFFEDKNAINDGILRLYTELQEHVNSKYIADLQNAIEQVEILAKNCHESIESGKIEDARGYHEKAVEIFKNVPKGFLRQKIEAGSKLIALYKELSIHAQIESLKQQLNNAHEAYSGHDKTIDLLSEMAEHKPKRTKHKRG